MSKTYHFNDPYPHIKDNYRDIKFINDFSVSDYLSRFENVIHSKKYNHQTDIKNILHILEEGCSHFQDRHFTKERLFRFLENLLTLCNSCSTFSNEFAIYVNKNPIFAETLYKCTFDNTSHLSFREKLDVLWIFACLKIQVSSPLIENYFNYSINYLNQYEGEDFYKALEALVLLDVNIPIEWQEQFIFECKSHIKEIDALQILYIDEHLDMFDKNITRDFKAFLSPYKPSMQLENLNTRFENLLLKDEEGYPNHTVNDWFYFSSAKMSSVTPFLVIKAFLHLTYERYELPEHWVNNVIEKITDEFYLLTGNDIIRALYTFTLRMHDIEKIRPFIKKCNAYFEYHPKFISNILEIKRLRKIILIKKYFGSFGFDFHLDYSDHFELFKTETSKDKTITKIQREARPLLQSLFPNETLFSEFYIDEIADTVDYCIPKMKLICEVDGESHIKNGKENAITQLKTFLLTRYGYSLVRLENSSVRNEGIAYIQSQVLQFLPGQQSIFDEVKK